MATCLQRGTSPASCVTSTGMPAKNAATILKPLVSNLHSTSFTHSATYCWLCAPFPRSQHSPSPLKSYLSLLLLTPTSSLPYDYERYGPINITSNVLYFSNMWTFLTDVCLSTQVCTAAWRPLERAARQGGFFGTRGAAKGSPPRAGVDRARLVLFPQRFLHLIRGDFVCKRNFFTTKQVIFCSRGISLLQKRWFFVAGCIIPQRFLYTNEVISFVIFFGSFFVCHWN